MGRKHNSQAPPTAPVETEATASRDTINKRWLNIQLPQNQTTHRNQRFQDPSKQKFGSAQTTQKTKPGDHQKGEIQQMQQAQIQNYKPDPKIKDIQPRNSARRSKHQPRNSNQHQKISTRNSNQHQIVNPEIQTSPEIQISIRYSNQHQKIKSAPKILASTRNS